MGFGEQLTVHKDSIKEEDFIEKKDKICNFVILKKNNFNIVFQNDILIGAKDICKLNNTEHNYNTTSIYDLIKNNYTFPICDIIIGGFPCQDFSHSGKRQGFESEKTHDLKSKIIDTKENSRGTLYKSFVEVVKRTKPKIFVAENVYGLLTMRNEPIKQIIKDFSDIGYDVEYQLINCKNYGIPQNRKRVIILGISKTRKIKELNINWNIIEKNKINCNVGKYLEHLQEPNITTDLSQKIYSKSKKLQKGQGQTEINLKEYSPTIRSEHHGNIEFRRYANSKINVEEKELSERRLTLREVGLIQTFPPNFIFAEKNTMKAYKYIGNAVPPLMSYIIANKVEEILKHYF